MRISKAYRPQNTDLQKDALIEAGIEPEQIYEDHASGKKDDRPQLQACLKALFEGDTLLAWKLARLGRSLKHLIAIVNEFGERGIALKVLTGQGAALDTTTPVGRMVFSIVAALAEFERELISERTKAGLVAAWGRPGGRPRVMTDAKIRMASARMKDRNTNVSELCGEMGFSRQTLYRYFSPGGEIRG